MMDQLDLINSPYELLPVSVIYILLVSKHNIRCDTH